MLGHKVKEFGPLTAVSLEDLVPEDNFYRQVERSIDLNFVHDLANDFYSNIGRPSIDPVVFFKLQLIAFFEGIRSERRLMETVNLNLGHRWFIGYDLDEPVPDHSSLSKIRERYGLEAFQLFFEHIVELCIKARLVWGEELYFDSTKVQANANINGMIERAEFETKQHLDQLFDHLAEDEPSFGKLISKYNGKRHNGIRKPHYQRITDDKLSPIDPDAAPMQPSGGGGAILGYRDHYVVDGGKARIILSALVTPASIMDNTPILDLVDWVRFRWKITPKLAVGDAKYGTVPNIVGLEERGIKAYLPASDFSQRTKYYSAKLFHYDSEKDHYVCPQGQILPLVSRRTSEQVLLYKSKTEVCNACPVKSKCTGSKSGRHIFRSFFQEYLDKAEGYRQTEAYLKAMRKRSVWVEPLFGEAKEFHRLRRFRLRRLLKVNIEGVMIAAGQNLKRLIKHDLCMLFSFPNTAFQRLNFRPAATFSTGWIILRLPIVVVIALQKAHPIMFEIGLDNRNEVLHPADAGLAIVNALRCEAAWDKVLLVGGGATCQLYFREYFTKLLTILGIGPLPEEAYSQKQYYTDWLDTAESQQLLNYQRHSFDDILEEIGQRLGYRRYMIPLVRPFVRRSLLRLSPYWLDRDR